MRLILKLDAPYLPRAVCFENIYLTILSVKLPILFRERLLSSPLSVFKNNKAKMIITSET